MNRQRLHRVIGTWTTGLLIAALGSGLVGCATNAGPISTRQPTDIATIGEAVDGAALGEQVRVAMEAVSAFRTESSSSTETRDGEPVSTGTTMLVDRTDPELTKVRSESFIASDTARSVVMIQIGADIYTQLDGGMFVHSTGTPDPKICTNGVDTMLAQADDVRLVGTDNVDGVAVRHYLMRHTASTVDLYLDATDRLIKTVTTTAPPDTGQSDAALGTSISQTTWHDYERPIIIEAPPAHEIESEQG